MNTPSAKQKYFGMKKKMAALGCSRDLKDGASNKWLWCVDAREMQHY